MPRRDGTGPLGEGAMTGRGLGACADSEVEFVGRRGSGFGRGFRCGSRGRFGMGRKSAMTQKELLNDQKLSLQARLNHINKKLEDL